MKKFFQSQLYANFWKFSILAPLMAGLFTAVLTALFILFAIPLDSNMADLPWLAGTFGGVATCMTFMPALLGFWIVWFIGRKEIASFSTVSIMTALMLGLIVLFAFLNPTKLPSDSKGLMVLFDVSLLGSVVIFYKLSKKYIEPVLF